MSLALWLSGRRTKSRLSGPGRFGAGLGTAACFGGLAVGEEAVATGAGRVTADAYVDWARPGVAEGGGPWEGRACWVWAGGLEFSTALGAEIPQIKALKWRWATEARSSLREARASRKWGARSETWFRCWSRKVAIGLNIAWPSAALVVAATVESSSAAWRGPPGPGLGGIPGMAAAASSCISPWERVVLSGKSTDWDSGCWMK